MSLGMKRAFGFVVMAAALLLAACDAKAPEMDAVAPVAEAPAAGPVKPVDAATEVDCKTAGGEWRPVCRMQQNMCVQTFADAGKTCSGAADCSGRCLADGSPEAGKPVTGKCAVNNDPCGCYQRVEGGVAQATICVD